MGVGNEGGAKEEEGDRKREGGRKGGQIEAIVM